MEKRDTELILKSAYSFYDFFIDKLLKTVVVRLEFLLPFLKT